MNLWNYHFDLFSVSGLGFGAISAVVQFGNILHESGGPAIPGVTQSSSQYLVLTSGM